MSIGGLDGYTLDLSVQGTVEPCGTRASLFVHSGTIEDGFWWDLSSVRRMYVYLLDAGDGHNVVINVEALHPDFEAFVAAAEPIVQSFDFTP